MTAHHLRRGERAEFGRGAGRDRTGVEGGEVAPGRHHVEAAAARRAGGPRRHEAAVEGGEQACALAVATCSGAEDVEPVAKRDLAEIAEMGIEMGQGLL